MKRKLICIALALVVLLGAIFLIPQVRALCVRGILQAWVYGVHIFDEDVAHKNSLTAEQTELLSQYVGLPASALEDTKEYTFIEYRFTDGSPYVTFFAQLDQAHLDELVATRDATVRNRAETYFPNVRPLRDLVFLESISYTVNPELSVGGDEDINDP